MNGIKIDEKPADLYSKSGSERVAQKKFDQAIDEYTKAIELDPNNYTYYSNRSLCYYKLERYGLAINDANKCLDLNSKFYKGYYRRGVAEMSLGRIKKALDDFTIIHKILPKDKDISEKYKYCYETYNKELFAKAIHYVQKSYFDDINLEALSLKDSEVDFAINMESLTPDVVVKLMDYFKQGKVLHSSQLYKLLFKARHVLKSKKTLVRITLKEDIRLTVCGDVHGQFYDLCNIFEINGLPSSTNQYLFNGDFVDRGFFSIEVIITLLMFQVLYPDSFFLNRGNHECASLNKMYGFEKETVKKYSLKTFNMFGEIFDCLPIAHLIDEKVLVIHGGLPGQDGVKLEDIEKIDRFKEPMENTLMFDLMWTDPGPNKGRAPSARGVATMFGPDVTEAFCKLNNLKYIIRSHEAQMNGYSETHNKQCITIFSAPNYCDEMQNKGAFIHIKKDLIPVFQTFDAVFHPPTSESNRTIGYN